MFDNKIEGIGTWSSFGVSILLLISGILLASSRSWLPEWLAVIALICFILVLCIWVTLGRQYYERRLQERAEEIARSKRMEKP